MAESSKEIDVINQHNGLIENTISVDLNYFSGKFVEKGFITRDVSGDIAGMYGVGSREKARRLLQAAIGSLKLVPDRQKCVWFHGFVAIFSSEAPYRNLADTLLRAYQPGTQEVVPPVPDQQAVLVIQDLHDVHTDLINVAQKWYGFGLALGLHPDLIERIGENTAGVENRLCEVLKRWLKQEYDTKRHGLPSWTLLVKAVAHKTGGANPALAQQLAQAHNVTL